ncbi:MAG: hypothetical protein NTU85_00920 [Candidatus Kaiserbacteria bacterium]|nr:hypothetical protein [Candidatus Kaiserbacteria bacterium]
MRFFLGTPRRLLATLGGFTFFYGLAFPQKLGAALNELFYALEPLFKAALLLGVVFIGLGVMLKGVWRKGGK